MKYPHWYSVKSTPYYDVVGCPFPECDTTSQRYHNNRLTTFNGEPSVRISDTNVEAAKFRKQHYWENHKGGWPPRRRSTPAPDLPEVPEPSEALHRDKPKEGLEVYFG